MTHPSIRIIREEHMALAAMLRSLGMMLDRGTSHEPEVFFEVVRAMLFYIDEFPEKRHHPKESNLLFPRVVRLAPEVFDTVVLLEKDHNNGESIVRELQHMLLAWELLGEPRRAVFEQAVKRYISFYLEHMRLEEAVILPAAQRVLDDQDWAELDVAFATNCDPLTGKYPRDATYDRLFTRIVTRAPAPIGLGAVV
jgi:hemerythrin-like domain-containing protein